MADDCFVRHGPTHLDGDNEGVVRQHAKLASQNHDEQKRWKRTSIVTIIARGVACRR